MSDNEMQSTNENIVLMLNQIKQKITDFELDINNKFAANEAKMIEIENLIREKNNNFDYTIRYNSSRL